jgi:hypothetical protein
MRFAFAAIALLSCTGLAVAASHKSDNSDSPKAPEQGSVQHAPGVAPRSGGFPMMGRPELQGGAPRVHIPPPQSAPPPASPPPAAHFTPPPAVPPAAPVQSAPVLPGAHPVLPGVSGAGRPHDGGPRGGHDGGRGDGGATRGHHDGGHDGATRAPHDGGAGRPSNGSHGGDRHHRGHGGGVVVFPYPPLPTGTWWPYPPYPDTYGTYSGDEEYGDDGTDTQPPDETPPVFWYYCDQPDGFYPYVKSCSRDWSTIPISAPPPGSAVPLSYSDWQWCEDSKSFFPYVSSCRSGFVSVPVTAPKSDSAPAIANWFFCEDPKGYLPYVVQCKKDWRAVPAVPPPSVPVTVKNAPERK